MCYVLSVCRVCAVCELVVCVVCGTNVWEMMTRKGKEGEKDDGMGYVGSHFFVSKLCTCALPLAIV